VKQWLSAELTAHLRTAFQEATGERAEIDCVDEQVSDCSFYWQQPFAAVAGSLWIAAENDSHAKVFASACNGLAQALSGLLDRQIRCEGGEAKTAAPANLKWLRFDLMFADAAVTLFAAGDSELLKALSKEDSAPEVAKTFDLLFDVELPVSVSFGRAQVALKDVLKLTTGSIVELNRAIGDPVEVIVNNCVIARGEVVTIEGNFGVRIHQVISRQERLRTLK
jgi:flagellar motor switch protein FliN/FliY